MQRLQKILYTQLRLFAIFIQDNDGYHIIRQVKRDNLTFLGMLALVELYDRVRQIERDGRNGVLIEAGCARGGSALVMSTAKTQARPLRIFDAFGMIPAPTQNDGKDAHERYSDIVDGRATGIRGDTYYGYEMNLFEQVQDTFRMYGFDLDKDSISLEKGLYEEVLFVENPVALAHIDCDWHDSVTVCLERIVPYLVPGGVLVVDDYHTWSGCKRAVDTFFGGREESFTFELKSRLHITRIK